MIRRIFYFLVILSLTTVPVLAQQQDTFTTKVYEVKYKRASDIAKLLIGYDSKTYTQSQILLIPESINEAFNTFTVRALPEGHAVVAEIIQKFDLPDKTIEFQFFLIKANITGEGLKDGVPDKVRKALNDVASLTRYKGFELIDAPFIRVKEGRNRAFLDGKGIYSYSLALLNPQIVIEKDRSQINIDEFEIGFSVPTVNSEGKSFNRNILLRIPFNIAEGEIVVLGASQIEREGEDPGAAIITIVTSKIL